MQTPKIQTNLSLLQQQYGELANPDQNKEYAFQEVSDILSAGVSINYFIGETELLRFNKVSGSRHLRLNDLLQESFSGNYLFKKSSNE